MAAGCFGLDFDNASFCQTDTCGVFASSSMGDDDTGDGTREKPFKTLSRALSVAGRIPVYACGEAFEETLELNGIATLFGARDCKAGWEYNPDVPSTLAAGPGEIPLRIAEKAEVAVYDFTIRAAAGEAPGQSSIAVLAEEGAAVEMERCLIESGDGAPAVDEAAPAPASDGVAGTNGADACTGPIAAGPAGAVSQCEGAASFGGKGGDGDGVGADQKPVDAQPGGPGSPGGMPNGGDAESDAAQCAAGTDGAAGMDGAAGASATESLGAIGPKNGFTGARGTSGKPGQPGQGGGGGGGAKGGAGDMLCADPKSAGGASGGSGGGGGCGGQGGRAGRAGGSSIGFVSLRAQIAFKEVTITTGAGGKGGDGADGQPGGQGAAGGLGGTPGATSLNAACNGGSGGAGGKGGPGGGGRGGHSIGIAYLGDAPPTDGATINVGAAAPGGVGAGSTGKAGDGVAVKVQLF